MAVVLPFVPFAGILGMTRLPLSYIAPIAVIVAAYVASGELAKSVFYRRFAPDRAR